LRCQASSVAGVTGKTWARCARYQLCESGEPYPAGGLVPDPPGVPAQDGVLVPERRQFSVLGQIFAREQDQVAEYAANQQVEDRERHPASQPSPPPGRREGAGRLQNRIFGRHSMDAS